MRPQRRTFALGDALLCGALKRFVMNFRCFSVIQIVGVQAPAGFPISSGRTVAPSTKVDSGARHNVLPSLAQLAASRVS